VRRSAYSIPLASRPCYHQDSPTRALDLLAGEIHPCPDLPVMMVTAYGDDEHRRLAAEVGAFEFIVKPVDFCQLKEQLRQLPAAAD
jgi:CheY-like chemotaxis protein